MTGAHEMSRRKALFKALSAMLLVLAAMTTVQAQTSVSSLPIQAKERAALFPDSNSIAQGKTLAEAACMSCHGLDGLSIDESRPHLAGQRTIYLYREMLAYKAGQRRNEAMAKAVAFLDSEALLKTAIYYSSLSLPFDRETAEELTNGPAKIDDDPLMTIRASTAGCASCHGAEGNSMIPGMPSLTSQHPDYFSNAMLAYQSGERKDNMMQLLVANLDEQSIRNMGLYYALQEPGKTSFKGAGNVQAGQAGAEACASCHGASGNAPTADMPSLAGMDPGYFAKTIRDYQSGQRPHAAMTGAVMGLEAPQVDDLAAYYAEQEPVARNVRKPLSAAQWVERCARCHGTGGNSNDPRYARLAGQNRQYLLNALQAYADGQRSDSVMHAMAEPLDQGVIERLATYYAAQEPRSVVYFELPCNTGETQ
jgi:cytochrome c553